MPKDYGPATTGNRAPPRPARPVVAVLPSSERGRRAYRSLSQRVGNVLAARLVASLERQRCQYEMWALLVSNQVLLESEATSWLQTHGYWEGS